MAVSCASELLGGSVTVEELFKQPIRGGQRWGRKERGRGGKEALLPPFHVKAAR